MKQDGEEFSPASDAMLQQAADGELVLWAFTRRHTAKLRAFPWAVAPTQATRSCAAVLVPSMPELASELLGYPYATLKNYLATDPTDCLESHPWKDHYWVLDEPQTVTREMVYFRGAPMVPAAPDNVATAKRSRKKPSIEAVAFDYMCAEFKKGQFQSAAKFHKHLISAVGKDGSPFEMGTGNNARKLFCPGASSFFDEGTLGKMWAKIRTA